jgi:sugar lactone lactonase YvrE
LELKNTLVQTGTPSPNQCSVCGEAALCNDIAIGPDGTAYATDTVANRIVRLKKGAAALDVW